MNRWWRSRDRYLTRIIVSVALLSLLMLLLAVISLRESYHRHERRGMLETRNLVQLLARDVEDKIRMIEVSLDLAADQYLRFYPSPVSPPQQDMQFAAYLEQLRVTAGLLDGLRLVDVSGITFVGTGVDPGERLSVADREYFKVLQSSTGPNLFVGEPIRGRTSGKWVLPIARRLTYAEGRFAGVVIGTLDVNMLVATFQRLETGPRSVFNVFSKAGRLVARYPESLNDTVPIGTVLKGEHVGRIVSSNETSGSGRTVYRVDGIERVYSYQLIPRTQMYVTIGEDWAAFLSDWKVDVQRTIGLLFGFMVISVGMTWFIYRGWRQQKNGVAALEHAYRSLAVEKQLSQTIIRSSPFAIYTRDRQGIVTAWNPAAEKLFGWTEAEILGKSLLSVPPEKVAETEQLRDRVLQGETIINCEVRRQRRDGSLFDLNTTLAPLRDAMGAITGYLAIAADITERRIAEQQIEFLAYRDVLTGLPNRLLLQDRFEQAMAHADRSGSRVALLFLDLDNFKTINDSLGHATGDALLQEIANRLGACVRETDTISRQGGDEFLIVLPELRNIELITPILLKIRETLQVPFAVDDHELTTSASIGVALYPDDGVDFDTLLKKADTAMYRAKDAGRNHYRFFDEQMNVEAVEHLQFKSGLRRALMQDEFELHYQPQIDLASGRVIGAEALIRWHHPERGLVPPARFIPVAEDSGLIVPIGEWVLQQACRQAMAWRAAGFPPLLMAVNLSAVQFRRGDVHQTVLQALQTTGFDPHLLELELTESILIHDTENVLASVRQLKQLGVKLSIDDFGTGYSSLQYLKRFDVDKLKIDQSFVRDLATDPDDAAIVRAIIQMAGSLNLRTIAEGVEDDTMLQQLRQFGCNEAQGYFFARPMTAELFSEFMLAQLEAHDPVAPPV